MDDECLSMVEWLLNNARTTEIEGWYNKQSNTTNFPFIPNPLSEMLIKPTTFPVCANPWIKLGYNSEILLYSSTVIIITLGHNNLRR